MLYFSKYCKCKEKEIHLIHYRISVKNEFLDEKEDACTSLGELAGNTG